MSEAMEPSWLTDKPVDEAEKRYLSCCMHDNALIDELLAKEHDHAIFGSKLYRSIGRAMIAIRERNEPVNHVTLLAELEADRGEMSAADVVEVMTCESTSMHWKTYFRIVQDACNKRKFSEAVEVLSSATRSVRFMDVRESVEAAISKISEICLTEKAEKPGDMFVEALAFVESMERGEKPRNSRPIHTGIPRIDKKFTPLNVATGDHNVLIFGPTSTGKSSLSAQVIGRAIRDGFRVAVFVGETSKNKLPLQIVSQRTRVRMDMHGFPEEPGDRQRLGKAELKRFQSEAEGLLFVYDSNFTIESIMSRCRNLASKEGPIDLIVIDHLHLLKTSRRFRDTKERIEYLSGCLKPLAKELDCVCLSLAQPSREMQKEMRFPSTSDLKDSGSLENDADRIWALYMPREDSDKLEQDRMTPCPEVWLVQLKNRDGETGYERLKFEKRYTLFTELEGRANGSQ